MHTPAYAPVPAPSIKRLHSVVCFAFRPSQNELKCYAIFVAASTVEEAKGDRMHKLLQVHSIEDGWESHSVEAIAVPDRIVQEAAMALFEADDALTTSRLVHLDGPAPEGFSVPANPHAPVWDVQPLTVAGGGDLSELRTFLDAHADPSLQVPRSLLLPPTATQESDLTVPAGLPSFRVEGVPRLTGGAQILVGSSRQGKILPAEHLHGAALEAAQTELSAHLNHGIAGVNATFSPAQQPGIKVIGPAEPPPVDSSHPIP